MGIYYRRRIRAQGELAKKSVQEHRVSKTCPSCGNSTKLIEAGTDRDTYACETCTNVSVFTNVPKSAEKVKQMGMLTVRNKSNTRGNETQPIDTPSMAEMISKLREAMETASVVSFSYWKSDKKAATLRSVEPYKLIKNQDGNVVLYAYDLEGEGLRVFTLSKMSKISILSYAYSPRWEIEDKLKPEKTDGTQENKG